MIEGKLTREQLKASATEVKAEIGSLRGELGAKMDTVTFLFPSPPLTLQGAHIDFFDI